MGIDNELSLSLPAFYEGRQARHEPKQSDYYCPMNETDCFTPRIESRLLRGIRSDIGDSQ